LKTNLDSLGKWPISGKEARKNKRLIYIPKNKMLRLIHGKKNHILVSFFVSNDYINFGTMQIPKGIYSDPEIHKGDEVLFVLEGKLSVQTYDKEKNDSSSVLNEIYEIYEGEQFLIPERIKHRYLNFSDTVVKVLFGIAPRL